MNKKQSIPSKNEFVVQREAGAVPRYHHARYHWRRALCRFLLRTVGFTLLAKVDRVEGMENVPPVGPGIIMMNHIAYIDPIVLVHIMHRYIVPLAKLEAYNHPIEGIFPRLWGVIPVNRHAFDRQALKRALDVLDAGELLLVAPEGTRSPALQQAREGAAYLASRSGAPIIPVALEDTVGFPTLPFSRRWWGVGAYVKVGKPFRFRAEFKRARGPELEKMSVEAMCVLASLLSPDRRGVYADLSKATQDTIEFIEGAPPPF